MTAWLLDLLFPPKCVFCGRLLRRGEADICAPCQRDLPWIGGPAAEQRLEFISLCASPLWYQGAVRGSLHRYKFRGRMGYAACYGRLAGQCARDHLAGRFDLVTWVPLSARREKARGYDQARLLAQAAARELGGQAVGTLVKDQDRPAQSGMGRDDAVRRANVLGAYRIARPEPAAGKRVLLVDDIVTSGSTLSECARVLRTAGAADVVCVTLARARGE